MMKLFTIKIHDVAKVSRCYNHTMFAADNKPVSQYVGKNRKPYTLLYVWGFAGTGALGLPDLLNKNNGKLPRLYVRKPVLLPWANRLKSNRITTIACGIGFTVFGSSCSKIDNLFGTGLNTCSQLGYLKKNISVSDLDYVVSPSAINLPLTKQSSITKVSAGRAHTLILTDSNGVISLGNNAYGQCGRSVVDGECFKRSKTVNFLLNVLPSDVCNVVCGLDHSFFLCTSGEVYGCGWNSDGQLGLNHCELVAYPERIKGDIENEHIVKIACKGDFAIALNEKGDIFGWGNNEYNQLLSKENVQVMYPTHIPLNFKVKDVAASGTITLVLSESNDLYAWGFGSLGNEKAFGTANHPMLIPRNHFYLDTTDTLIESITSGLNCLAVITNKHELYMWGINEYGNLGVGKVSTVFIPTKVSIPAKVTSVYCGVDHTVAICKSFI